MFYMLFILASTKVIVSQNDGNNSKAPGRDSGLINKLIDIAVVNFVFHCFLILVFSCFSTIYDYVLLLFSCILMYILEFFRRIK